MAEDKKTDELAELDSEAIAEKFLTEHRAKWLRHKLPATRDLQHTLNAMTRDELNDICANLNVHGTSSSTSSCPRW